MPTVTAWHGDPALKAEALARMQAHREADEIVQGAFAEESPLSAAGYRGCFHGCLTTEKLAAEAGVTPAEFARKSTNHGLPVVHWHSEGERVWGIPEALGHALDRTFESLARPDHAAFAVDAIDAMPVGADLSQVIDRWTLDILADPERGAARHATEGSEARAAVERVAGLYVQRLAGEEPSAATWEAAQTAAADIYFGAGTLAPDDDVAYVAREAAVFAELGEAHNAAEAATAAEYLTGTASKAAFWRWAAGRLLAHIAAAPVPIPVP